MDGRRISIFPLAGAVLFPGLQLPLRIFEPRYCAMISDALARDRTIGMIQPRSLREGPDSREQASREQASREGAPLYQVGCLGHIGEVEALEDGRYNIVLKGQTRFRMMRELTVATPFRQIEGEMIAESDGQVLAAVERAMFEREARRFADAQGYQVDWNQVTRLDDASLINGVSQIAPFDAAAKQALLESATISTRCELLVQLMQFFGRRDSDDGHATMQ